jgi:surfactin synthase thioesterase subunit
MTSFVLIPGAGGDAWVWHRLVPHLERAGHEAIAIELPADDEQAGLREYERIVVDAIARRDDVVLVAQSLGGFTAPMVAAAVPVGALVLLNAMIPVPGETPGGWWASTGWQQARLAAAAAGGYSTELDPAVYFLHDVPPEVLATGPGEPRPEADAVFASVCEFRAWPSVPIRVVAGADDRMFPAEFQRKVACERLGIEADVLAGGHLLALSQPDALAGYLLSA